MGRERDEEALDRLRFLKKGDTIFTILKHVARSGMYRVVDVRFFRVVTREVSWSTGERRENGSIVTRSARRRVAEPLWLSYNCALALGLRWDKRHEGVGMGGCGYDVGHGIVYKLSLALFGDGYCLEHRWL